MTTRAIKTFTLFLFVFFAINLFAQEITYFNTDWVITSKENANFYRETFASSNQKLLPIKDYWMSGELQMTGVLKNKEPFKKHGDFKWFHKNGKIKSEGYYDNDMIFGKWNEYSENGLLTETRIYNPYSIPYPWYKIITAYDTSAAQIVYAGNGDYLSQHSNGQILEKGF